MYAMKCQNCEWCEKLPSGNIYCKFGRCIKERIAPSRKKVAHDYKPGGERHGRIQVLTHEFSSKSSKFVRKKLKRSITCTVEGFLHQ